MPSGTSFGVGIERIAVRVARATSRPANPCRDSVLNVRPWYRIVSPGLSSVPASRLPIITVSAPAAIAFVTSPENLMPPSAISGMPAFAGRAAAFRNGGELRNAGAGDDARGADGARPDADLDAVHAQARSVRTRLHKSPMLPAISCTPGSAFFTAFTASNHAQAVGVRRIDRDHIHFAPHQFLRALQEIAGGADRRAHAQAGPARPWPQFGYFSFFWISLTVIRPLRM